MHQLSRGDKLGQACISLVLNGSFGVKIILHECGSDRELWYRTWGGWDGMDSTGRVWRRKRKREYIKGCMHWTKANSKTELPTPTDQIVAHLSLSWKTLLKMLILFLVFFLPSLKERSSQFWKQANNNTSQITGCLECQTGLCCLVCFSFFIYPFAHISKPSPSPLSHLHHLFF